MNSMCVVLEPQVLVKYTKILSAAQQCFIANVSSRVRGEGGGWSSCKVPDAAPTQNKVSLLMSSLRRTIWLDRS